MQRTARAIFTALLSCGALVTIALVSTGTGSRPDATSSVSAISQEAGMRAVIDPETGTISGNVPLPSLTDAEKAALQPASPPVLHQEFLPDGSVMIDLQGTMQEYYVMQIDPTTGKRTVSCVSDPNTVTQPTAQPEDR
jgi:hypothetical protein